MWYLLAKCMLLAKSRQILYCNSLCPLYFFFVTGVQKDHEFIYPNYWGDSAGQGGHRYVFIIMACYLHVLPCGHSSAGLGFNIRGGIDNAHVRNDPGIFVTTVKMNGAAAKDGRLQPGDKILEASVVSRLQTSFRGLDRISSPSRDNLRQFICGWAA